MDISRRSFIAASGTIAAATIIKPESVVGSTANSVLRYGLIGCGGRGGFMTEVFKQNPNYKIIAASDYFSDRLKNISDKFELPENRRFDTLSGYKKILDCNDVDMVVIETPPGFHPEQTAASVDAGKHVFLSKPIAVDVPGTISIEDSGKKATEKKLGFLVDYQTRTCPLFREALKRVHAGDIGQIVSLYSFYPWSAGGPDTKIDTPESYLANWYQSMELSGDCIVEQDVHTIDVATWIIGKDPISASGNGGRKTRKHGDIYDHYTVNFQFPGNITLQFASVKFVPGVRDEIICNAWGTNGTLETDYFGNVCIRGRKPYEGGKVNNLYWAGAVTNAKEFYDAISSGDFSNPTVAPSVRSNLCAILGRDATRKKKTLTWDEMLKSNEKLEMKLEGLKR